jgi:phosphoribosylanthranilate isomerase
MKVKICGVTRREDAMHAARAGADFLGLNLWPGSRRHVGVERAAELAAAARQAAPAIAIVGVFVDAGEDAIVAAVRTAALDVVQLHGHEPPALTDALVARGLTVWRAASMATAADVDALAAHRADAFLLDTPTAGRGGSGRTFDWRLAAEAIDRGHRVVLAGGLDADNVAEAIAAVGPWAVDVASGVELAPGHKDPARVERFIAAARAAAAGAAPRHEREAR